MPENVQKKQLKQLTLKQANSSRMVTACRFVVEIRNGHLKNIRKIFHHNLLAYYLPSIMTDLRIGASLINKYFITIESNKNDFETIAKNMIDASCYHNELAVVVNGRAFNNAVKDFVEVENASKDLVFPKIDKRDFKLISLGNYRPKIKLK